MMRGAYDVLVAKHSRTAPRIANRWWEKVVMRYLRMKKYTCFDRETHEKTLSDIHHRIIKKHYGLTGRSFCEDYDWEVRCEKDGESWEEGGEVHGHCHAWINGEHVEWMTKDKFLAAAGLAKMIEKIDDIAMG